MQIRLSRDPVPLQEVVRILGRQAQGHWLVVPTDRQKFKIEHLLKAEPISAEAVDAGAVRLHTLRGLPKQLLGDRSKRPISSTYNRLLTAECVTQTVLELDYFGRVRDTAGFPAALSDLFRELKQACIWPADLLAAAAGITDEQFARKTVEIGRLYEQFAARLNSQEECDDEDLAAMTIEHLLSGNTATLPLSMDLVGFYSFTTAQLELFAALGKAQVRVQIHLQCDPDRPILFAVVNRTIDALAELGAVVDSARMSVPSPSNGDPPAKETPRADSSILADVVRGIFGGKVDPRPGSGSVTILEAPGDYVEAEMIATQIRLLHDKDKVDWDDCVIVVRSVGEHASRLRCVMERFEIPIAASTLEALIDNPCIQMLVRLLELIGSSWPRRELLQVLRSSYLGIDLQDVDRFERELRHEGVLESPEASLQVASQARLSSIARFLERLTEWREELTAIQHPAVLGRLVQKWSLQCLLGKVWRGRDAGSVAGESSLPSTPAAQVPPGHREKPHFPLVRNEDREALAAAHRVGLELVHLRESPSGQSSVQITMASFLEDLLSTWRSATFSIFPARQSQVLLMDPYDVTPREFRVVFMAGLLEGAFPRRISEDPFFRDDERKTLAGMGLRLRTAIDATDEERLLFYRSLGAAREHLFLSHPRVTGDGRDCLRSFYVGEVEKLVRLDPTADRHSRTLAEVAPRVTEAFSDRDHACSVAVAAGDHRPELNADFRERALHYTMLLNDKPNLLRKLFAGVEKVHLGIPDPAWWKDETNRSFAVSELEAFILCPYQFFARYCLALTVEREGPVKLDQGDILHHIVRRFLDSVGAGSMPPRDDAVRQLETLLDDELAVLKRDALPYQRRMLRLSLAHLLPAFYDREVFYRENTKTSPGLRELAFGDEAAAARPGDAPDPASKPAALKIEEKERPAVHVRGRIDRVDLTETGKAVVLEYKLGAIRTLKEMQSGASLQMPLYFMALEQVFGLSPAAAFYDSFDRNERRVVALLHETRMQVLKSFGKSASASILLPPHYERLMSVARAAALLAADEIASGRIDPTPGDHCTRCDFGDVCRQKRVK